MAIKKSQLYNMLWESCNALRGTMDATQYKDYVLVMLFWKYISDKADSGTSDIEIPKGCHFNDICVHKTTNCAEYTNESLKKLAEANGLSDDIKVNFLSKERLGDDLDKRVGDLIGAIEDSKLNFSSNREGDDDLIGDAYEFLMRKFAADSGKSKGQFYTPGEVSRLMAKLLGIDRDTRSRLDIYDPTCGSGSLLLRAKAEFCGDMDSIHLYGQESDLATKGMASMNFIVHGTETPNLKHGDTIDNPLHKEGNILRQFDYVVANPPFSQTNWIGSKTFADDTYGRWGNIFDPATERLIESIPMPPTGCGDYAFLLHVVKSMKSDGKAAVILPHGVLYRGKEEAAIREYLISKKIIRGIIGLPGNLFYGTGIPACIIILDKAHALQSKGIFMINAKDGFTKDGAKNRLREQDIRRIIDTWRAHEDGYLNDEPHYAHFATYEEIVEDNKCNLNVARYVKSKDKEIKQDINAHINLAGGLPMNDVDEGMSDYWNVCTTLKEKLYKPYGVDGYYRLIPSREEVADVISNDESYNLQANMFRESVESWCDAVNPEMKALTADCRPRIIISSWNDKLLKIGKEDKSLVDAYELYDQLMGYWHDEMQDDCYIIADNGWNVDKPEAPKIRKLDKKTGKYNEVSKASYNYDEMVNDLLPVSVVIEEFFYEEDKLIKQLDTEANECAEKLKFLVNEEYPQFFENRYFWNNDPTKALVEKRIKYSCARKPITNELIILQGYLPYTLMKGKGAAAQQAEYRNKHQVIFAHFDKFNKTVINNRIEEIQNYKPYSKDIIKVWKQFVELEQKRVTLASQSRKLKATLKENITKKYIALTEEQIKSLVVDCKWLKRLQKRFDIEMKRVMHQFISSIYDLQDRYVQTLPQIEKALNEKRTAVIDHISKMGFIPSGVLLQGTESSMPIKKSIDFVDTEIGYLPKDWGKPRKLDDIGKWAHGSGVKRNDAGSGNVACVRYGEIYTTHHDYIKEIKTHISQEIADTAKLLKKGDILFAASGETKEEIAKAVAFIGEEPTYAGGDIIILSPYENYDSQYLGYVLNTPMVNVQKAERGQGDAVVHIHKDQLATVMIPMPPSKDEQMKIAQVLSDIDSEIIALEKEKKKYEAIKQGMMQQLLTGKIRLV